MDDHESNVFKQLDEKDHLRGMLRVSVAKDRNLNNATLSWEGVNSKDVVEKQQEMEYANPIHPSWCK